MTTSKRRAAWQLPAGVTRGLWEYTHSNHIADDYDQYFAHNRLFEFDEHVLVRNLESHGGIAGRTVVDLGCGTGRALVKLARRGCRGLAVDLSRHMLDVVADKASAEGLDITCLRANLVELECLADNCVDHACCLFSTLGMIRGRDNRRRVLNHVRRILRPGGSFVLHVHNRWYSLYDPGGPWWLLSSFVKSLTSGDFEMGDRYFPYRGVHNMYLHIFAKGELRSELARAGFRIRQWIPLEIRRHRQLRWPWLAERFRANGWIVACT